MSVSETTGSESLILSEIWNRVDDVGGAARDTNRKRDEVAQLAGAARAGISGRVVLGSFGQRPRIVRLAAACPHVFAAMFPGSSRAWVRALAHGDEPPPEPGLVWADLGGPRLFEGAGHVDAHRGHGLQLFPTDLVGIPSSFRLEPSLQAARSGLRSRRRAGRDPRRHHTHHPQRATRTRGPTPEHSSRSTTAAAPSPSPRGASTASG